MTLRQHTATTEDEDFSVSVIDVMAPHPAPVTPSNDVTMDRSQDSSDQIVIKDVPIRGASVGVIVGALLALLVSAWAAIIPFVGPLFGLSADGTRAWTWNHVHALGSLAPGAVGVLACVMVLASARRPRGFLSSFALTAEGLTLFLCGAWLTVVPVVWPVLVGPYFHAASPSQTLDYWMAYSSGPGVLLAGFGAFVMRRADRRMVMH
jgi:hypothetical protein